MLYLLQRRGKYYFNRRVPEDVRKCDPRDIIRFSLKTQDGKKALRLAMAHNEQLEAYWSTLSQTGQVHSEENYKAMVKRARLLGFAYHPSQTLAELPLRQIIERVLHIEKENYNEKHVEALLGKEPRPVIKVGQVLGRYFDTAKDKIINKSPNQIRKWQNPLKKPCQTF